MSVSDNAKTGACKITTLSVKDIITLPLCDNNNDKENESDNLVTNSNDKIKHKIYRIYNVKLLWKLPWCIIVISLVEFILSFVPNYYMYHLILIYEHRYQYWRYATYMLFHADLTQLLLNASLQLLIGFSLEYEQGRWKVACIFLFGGVSGSIATIILHPHLSLMGASAGVYALLLSHVAHLIKNFNVLSYRYLRVACLCFLFLCDIGFTAFHYITNNNLNPRICLEAHVGGAVCGFCIGFLLFNKLIDHKKMPNNVSLTNKFNNVLN